MARLTTLATLASIPHPDETVPRGYVQCTDLRHAYLLAAVLGKNKKWRFDLSLSINEVGDYEDGGHVDYTNTASAEYGADIDALNIPPVDESRFANDQDGGGVNPWMFVYFPITTSQPSYTFTATPENHLYPNHSGNLDLNLTFSMPRSSDGATIDPFLLTPGGSVLVPVTFDLDVTGFGSANPDTGGGVVFFTIGEGAGDTKVGELRIAADAPSGPGVQDIWAIPIYGAELSGLGLTSKTLSCDATVTPLVGYTYDDIWNADGTWAGVDPLNPP